MQKAGDFPSTNRLSVIAAGIITGYALLPFVQVSGRRISFTLLGIFISLNLNFFNLISLISALLAAAGTDWMLRESYRAGKNETLPHLILPALTAGAIGIPLGFLEVGTAWWIILALGSVLILLVLAGEYISMNPNNPYFPLALMVLSATSYALFLIIAIAVRAANLRLYLTASILPAVYGLFAVRMLQLRFGGTWPAKWTAAAALVILQFTVALFYWPLTAVRFGLLLLGPAYALIGIAAAIEEHQSFRKIPLEPLVMTGVIWALALIFG